MAFSAGASRGTIQPRSFEQGHPGTQGSFLPLQLSGKGGTSGNWREGWERQRPAPGGDRADPRFRDIVEEHAKSHRDGMAHL
ncbi:MAG: hypothetical protein M1815_003822 [Lichina confinis]|nr:MAG: hypothetical protein M1815_003822 [Lichina confinis]